MHRSTAKVALTAGLAGAVIAFSGSNAFAADAAYVPNEVIVKYADNAAGAKRSAAADRAGVMQVLGSVRGLGSHVVKVSGDAAAAAARLNRSVAVEYAEPNYLYEALATPNDPSYGQMYGLNNTGQTGGTADADIDAPEGWNRPALAGFPQTGGAKVGIVDTGIQLAHSEFAGGRVSDCGGVNNFGFAVGPFIFGADPTIVANKCNDDNGHGSHVAGTIAANTNNGNGVAGVSFSSPLAICKGLNALGLGHAGDDRQLHRLGEPARRQGHLDVAGRDLGRGDAAAGRAAREQQRVAGHRGGRQRRQLDTQLPGRATPRWSRLRRPITTTRRRRSRRSTATSRWQRRA